MVVNRSSFQTGGELVVTRRRRRTSAGATTSGGGAVVGATGKTQIGQGSSSPASSYMFADVVKANGSWTVASNATLPPANMDANGYPLSGIFSKQINIPRQAKRPGNYIMTWVGGGPNTVMINPGGTAVIGSLNGANGTYRFAPAADNYTNNVTNFTVGVTTTGAGYSPVTRLSVVHQDDFTDWQANPNAWSRPYRQALIAAGFGVIRFLGAQGSAFDGANRAMFTDWASRKNPNYHNFTGSEFRAVWWAGTPSNGGAGLDYTLSPVGGYIFGGGAPVDKQIMHVQFAQNATPSIFTTATISANTINYTAHPFVGGEPITVSPSSGNSNSVPSGLMYAETYFVLAAGLTANTFQISRTVGGAALTFGAGVGNFTVTRCVTLNINSTGAFPIKREYGDQLDSGRHPQSVDGSSNPRYATMIFDADMACWCKYGGDSSDGTQGLTNGTPIEVLLDLCIQVNAHPWFVSSMFSLDPMTDWHTQLVAYLRANMPSWMVPRFEGVNEQWNFGNAFYGTRYAWNKGFFHWGTSFDQNGWQGKIISTMGQAILAAFGDSVPNTSKYWICNGSQTGSMFDGNHASTAAGNNNERMLSTRYLGQAAPAQSGYIKAPAYNYTTHTCLTNYYQPTEYKSLNELKRAISCEAVNAFNSSAQLAICDAYVQTLPGIALATATLTTGSPGSLTWTAHGRANNDRIALYTTGTLPTGLSPYVPYFAIVVDANTLRLTPDLNGTAINFTGTQSGTHTAVYFTTATAAFPYVIGQLDAARTWLNTVPNNLAGNKSVITFYEGGWSPDSSDNQDATCAITAATQANPCVITIGSGNTVSTNSGTTFTGLAAQVGGSISPSGIVGMTQLNCATFSPTFTAGSANIGGASLILNQSFSFRETGNTGQFYGPPEILQHVPYYVVTPGNPFQISATRGGPPIVFAQTRGSFSLEATPGWFVTAVAGNNITLDVDSSAFTAYTSGGTATHTYSRMQVVQFKTRGRLAPSLQGMNFGSTGTPVPALFNYIRDVLGGVFPAKLTFDAYISVWAVLQPDLFVPLPTTGEYPAYKAFNLS